MSVSEEGLNEQSRSSDMSSYHNQVALRSLHLSIRNLTKQKDGIYLLEGIATGPEDIQKEWRPVVAEYLKGKPIKWRHGRDKSLREFADATYGEVHDAEVLPDGRISFKGHLFGSSTIHDSLITEIAERQANNEPMGLSLTTEEFIRDGDVVLVYPTELTVTPVPLCESCRTVHFAEATHMPESGIETNALVASLQEQVTTKQHEAESMSEQLRVTAREAEEAKSALGELVEKYNVLSREHEEFVKRTDELQKELAENKMAILKKEREPIIENLSRIENDEMLKKAYEENTEYWTTERLQTRLREKQEASIKNFDISSGSVSAANASVDQNGVPTEESVVRFLMREGNASSDLLEAIKQKIQRDKALRDT